VIFVVGGEPAFGVLALGLHGAVCRDRVSGFVAPGSICAATIPSPVGWPPLVTGPITGGPAAVAMAGASARAARIAPARPRAAGYRRRRWWYATYPRMILNFGIITGWRRCGFGPPTPFGGPNPPVEVPIYLDRASCPASGAAHSSTVGGSAG
jgi:hypothetical protein